jgi:hypothetical protein
LRNELSEFRHIDSGDAIVTDAYGLDNYRYIIHTCGPVYIDGTYREADILKSCYEQSLKLARDLDLDSIVFPPIDSGPIGFPEGQALKIAADTVSDFLHDNELTVYLTVEGKNSLDIPASLYSGVVDYLDRNLAKKARKKKSASELGKKEIEKRRESISGRIKEYILYDSDECDEDLDLGLDHNIAYHEGAKPPVHSELIGMPKADFEPDESFSDCVIRMIDERGLTDPEVYKKANIDRKLFNHMKNIKDYKPKKKTAVALAIGMRLDIRDTCILLERAGYVLSRSSKFDLIIRYCIENGIYNIFEINELLFAHDQETLGC